jgi:hypothetical protein
MLGCCAALELAQKGNSVDLFDQDALPLRRASRVNEGKIHQGFIYSNDPTNGTARLMALGAMSFARNLSRWIEVKQAIVTSTPFVYAVNRETMVDANSLRRHFTQCASTINDIRSAGRGSYLLHDEPAYFRELTKAELTDILEPDSFVTAFTTSELAVDPRPVASALTDAVATHPRISFRGSTRVVGVEEGDDGKYRIRTAENTLTEGPYDAVVNGLWEGRLAVDRSFGLRPTRSPMYRHKYGNRILIPLQPAEIPSVTMILGPFGDIVNFGQNGMYLSWYPVGMVESIVALEPPEGWTDHTPERRLDVFRRSFQEWLNYCPRLGSLVFEDSEVDPVSGIIFAWGSTDIDDPLSELHERHSIGIETVGQYHSVNTGKYTVAPMLALEVARRVMGQS